MPSIRADKHAPTDTTSGADGQPVSRKSSRLAEKGPRVSPVSASGVSKSLKRKSTGKGQGKPKASVKAEPSASESAPPPAPAIPSIASPPRPILRVKTDVLPLLKPPSAHKCCLLRGPCLVCFSHESLLTPLFSATFPKRDWFPVQPSLAGRVMALPSPTTRVGQLRPAVWSPSASEFDDNCDEYTPRTPHFPPAKDLYAQSYMPEPEVGTRAHADPQANVLYGLQNVYHLPDLFTAFSVPTADFDPFRLVTASGVKPIFTHIVRILQVSDAIKTDQSLQQIFTDPESGSRTVVVHTIIMKDEKLSTGRQFHEVMHFLSAHLASESRPGLVDQFAAPPEHGRTRVLILAPFKKEEEESSPSLALLASPLNEGSDEVFRHGHIAPPSGAVVGSFMQRVNLLSVMLLALCKVTADKEHLMRALRSHLAMARTGRADAQLDDDDEVLINHLPWDTLFDVMQF